MSTSALSKLNLSKGRSVLINRLNGRWLEGNCDKVKRLLAELRGWEMGTKNQSELSSLAKNELRATGIWGEPLRLDREK